MRRPVTILPQQFLAQHDALLVIETQERRRTAADLRQGLNDRSREPEMPVPAVGLGIVQRCKSAGLRITRGDIRPLEAIAAIAGKRQIVQVRRAAMLLADDVIGSCEARTASSGMPQYSQHRLARSTTAGRMAGGMRVSLMADYTPGLRPARARMSETMSSNKTI